ncbi:MAG TPA: flippase [Dehalococcoidia bacterium]|nr:flippase [Dehalococcoidia bacterium]
MEVTEVASVDSAIGGRVARNTIVQLFGRFGTGGISLLVLMVLARYLGTDRMGEYLLVLSFLALLNISDMGLTTIAIRDLALRRPLNEQSTLLGNLILLRVLLAIAAALFVCLIALGLGYTSEVTAAICLGSASYVLSAIGTGSIGLSFAANLRMEYQVIATTVQGLVLLGLVGTIVFIKGSVLAVVGAYDVSILVGSLATIALAKRVLLPKFDIDFAIWRRLLSQSVPVTISFIAWLTYNRIDMVMLSKIEGSDSVGLYGMAYRFVDLLTPINMYFILSVYPILSRHHDDGNLPEMRRLFQKSSDVVMLIVLPTTLILAVFPSTILTIVASRAFVPAADSLRILALGVAVMAISGLLAHTALALGKQVELAKVMPFGLVLNVALNLLLIPRMNYEGSALATLLTEIVVGLYLFITVTRGLHFMPSFALQGKMTLIAATGGAATVLLLPDFLPLRIVAIIGVLALVAHSSGFVTRELIERVLAKTPLAGVTAIRSFPASAAVAGASGPAVAAPDSPGEAIVPTEGRGTARRDIVGAVERINEKLARVRPVLASEVVPLPRGGKTAPESAPTGIAYESGRKRRRKAKNSPSAAQPIKDASTQLSREESA